MKRVRCPKCDNFITFDETKYQAGQSLVFVCPNCNKQFGIRMGVSKLRETRKEEKLDENANEKGYGSIVVIENVFAYKQVIPLQLGDNIIGRYMKNSGMHQYSRPFLRPQRHKRTIQTKPYGKLWNSPRRSLSFIRRKHPLRRRTFRRRRP